MGNFLGNGHEVRNFAAIGGAIGALATVLGAPHAYTAIHSSTISSLQECLDYQNTNPNVVGMSFAANELPKSALRSCGLEQFVTPRDRRTAPDPLSMGGSVNYDMTKIVLPDPSLVQKKINSLKNINDPLLVGLAVAFGMFAGSFVGSEVRSSKNKRNVNPPLSQNPRHVDASEDLG